MPNHCSIRAVCAAAVFTAAVAPGVRAQAADPPASAAGRIIDAPLATSYISFDPVQFRVTVQPKDSAASVYGTWTIVQRPPETDHGRRRFLRVATMAGRSRTVVDSIVTDLETLAPLSEISHQGPDKVVTWNFAGRRVTGSVVQRDSGTTPIDQDTHRRVFDSSILDVVLRALPLSPGYRITLPMYWYELGGLDTVSVHVVGTTRASAPNGTRDAWLVETNDKAVATTVWLDRTSRRVLRLEYVVHKSGLRLTLTPIDS